MKEIVRIVLIGIGSMGKRYAQMISEGRIEGLTLSGICARSIESQNWVRENISQDMILYSDTEEMFAHSEDYDAVLVVTPHKLHPELTIRALQAGKHVMCDKPAGVSVTDAIAMQEEAQKRGLVYAMMFHNRTYPVLRKLKELLETGSIGTLNRILLENSIYYRTAYYHHSGSWRSSWEGEGGGALINQGQHILDYWQWLFGMPESLYANISFGKYNDFLVDDEAIIIMEYPNHLTGTFILTTGEIQREERLCVIGSKGKITMTGNKLTVERNAIDAGEYSKTVQINTRDNMQTATETIECDNPVEPYEKMLDNFVKAIWEEEPLIADGTAGIHTLQLTNGAYMSAWEKKRIMIPIHGAAYDAMLKEHIKEEGNKE